MCHPANEFQLPENTTARHGRTFGAGYFKKLSIAKALSEMPQFQAGGYR